MALDGRSSSLRDQVLIPNAGWLGEGVIILSDLLGLWDVFVLMAFFVICWVVMRTTSCEVSMILGMLFDLGIPLQYQNDQNTSKRHSRHLQNYWPAFTIGSLVEGAGYLFFHPDLFTLVVCMKTTGCLALWLSRRPDGSKITLRGAGSSGSGSNPTVRGVTSSAPRNAAQSRAAPDPTSNWDGRPVPPLVDPRYPDAADRFRAAGYDSLTIEGMIDALCNTNDKNARHNIKEWTKVLGADKMRNRRTKYSERAMKARQRRLDDARAGRNGKGIPPQALAGQSRSTRTGAAPTSRPAAQPPTRPAAGHPAGSWNRGGHTMAFSKDQINQIYAKIRQVITEGREGRGKSSDQIKKLAKDEVDAIQAMSDPATVQTALARYGIVVQSPARFRLSDQYTPKELLDCGKKLMYPHEKGGLGLPRQIVDLIMEDMMNQPTKAQAEAMFRGWMSLRKLEPKARNAGKHQLMGRYNDSIYLAEGLTPGYGPDRLVQPWDVPGL